MTGMCERLCERGITLIHVTHTDGSQRHSAPTSGVHTSILSQLARSLLTWRPADDGRVLAVALGRSELHVQLSWDMFGPDAMRVPGAELHLTKLKVKQLQEELAARNATRSGRKRALQLRLRALIITEAVEGGEE